MLTKLRGLTVRQFQEKASRRAANYVKTALFSLRSTNSTTVPVFILGYGRSGTTMLLNAFERDLRVDSYGEDDPRIAQRYLLDFEKLATAIERCKVPIMVAKPILNSFDVARLLDEHPNSKVVWMIRSYKDVALSANNLFGKRVSGQMSDLVLHDKGNNWLSQRMPAQTLVRLRELDGKNFTNLDWLALVWWSVNITIVEHKIWLNKCVLMLHYEGFVQSPTSHLHTICDFIGLEYKPRLSAYINARSVGKGADVVLNPIVEKMCHDLYTEIQLSR